MNPERLQEMIALQRRTYDEVITTARVAIADGAAPANIFIIVDGSDPDDVLMRASDRRGLEELRPLLSSQLGEAIDALLALEAKAGWFRALYVDLKGWRTIRLHIPPAYLTNANGGNA